MLRSIRHGTHTSQSAHTCSLCRPHARRQQPEASTSASDALTPAEVKARISQIVRSMGATAAAQRAHAADGAGGAEGLGAAPPLAEGEEDDLGRLLAGKEEGEDSWGTTMSSPADIARHIAESNAGLGGGGGDDGEGAWQPGDGGSGLAVGPALDFCRFAFSSKPACPAGQMAGNNPVSRERGCTKLTGTPGAGK